MQKATKLATTAAALVMVGIGAWWALSGGVAADDAELMVLRPNDARLTAHGAKIYAEQCASCHGANLEGQSDWRKRGPDGLLRAPPHDISGHTWHHPDEVLIRITRDGVAAAIGNPNYRTAMPVYRDVLSNAEIVAVLSWIKSQWPAAVRSKHDQINAQAR